MDAREDKERDAQQPPTAISGTGNGENSNVNKDPDLYDPMGMAGQKAGIVQELKEEACAPDKPEGKSVDPDADKSGPTPPLAGSSAK